MKQIVLSKEQAYSNYNFSTKDYSILESGGKIEKYGHLIYLSNKKYEQYI